MKFNAAALSAAVSSLTGASNTSAITTTAATPTSTFASLATQAEPHSTTALSVPTSINADPSNGSTAEPDWHSLHPRKGVVYRHTTAFVPCPTGTERTTLPRETTFTGVDGKKTKVVHKWPPSCSVNGAGGSGCESWQYGLGAAGLVVAGVLGNQ